MDISKIIFDKEELVHVLLDEIEIRMEFLIDTGNENFKMNKTRTEKWQEVADAVTKAAREFFASKNVEFDFKNPLTGDDAKKKYRNLRSTFNKKMKYQTGAASGDGRNWPFFDSMYRMHMAITRIDTVEKNSPKNELANSVSNYLQQKTLTYSTPTIPNDEEYFMSNLAPSDRMMLSGLIKMFYGVINKSDSHRMAAMDMLHQLNNSLYCSNDPANLKMVITQL